MATENPAPTERPVPTDPARSTRLQILATEHWSLLATRSLTYTECFSRVGMFLSVLSGSVIALALIAQAGRVGTNFFVAAILLLSVVVFLGMTTVVRLQALNRDDARWVAGMNRIRQAYLELEPDLADYFIVSSRDDIRGVMHTMGVKAEPGSGIGDLLHAMVILPGTVTVVVAVVAGALGVMVASVLGASAGVAVGAGGAIFLVTAVIFFRNLRSDFTRFARGLESRFPSDPA